MTAAVSIAQWLFNEGAGTSASDNAGNSNTLTIDHDSGNAAWNNGHDQGSGWEITAAPKTSTAIAKLTNISANGNIGSSLSVTTEASILIVVDTLVTTTSAERVFFIGSDSGNGDLAIVLWDGIGLGVRWGAETVNRVNYFPDPGSGLTTIAVVIDTNAGTPDGRIRAWYNNVEQTQVVGEGSNPASGATIDLDNAAYSMCIGNRPDGTRSIQGGVYYAELFTGQLTAQEISDSYDALFLDNDSNWSTDIDITPCTIEFDEPMSGSYGLGMTFIKNKATTNESATSVTVNTTGEASIISYDVIFATGSTGIITLHADYDKEVGNLVAGSGATFPGVPLETDSKEDTEIC